MVPKKSGMTIVENSQGEVISTRVSNSSRLCIDYRKLNEETLKDHFPLPFLDQMIEQLRGKSYFFFLYGFSSFYKIPVACVNKHETQRLILINPDVSLIASRDLI